MANIGQATFTDAGDVIILCDDEWTCCQREQAQAKVKEYNKNTPLTITDKVTEAQKDLKKECQADACKAMDKEMGQDQDAAADKFATSPCLAEQLKEPGASRSSLNLEMDHPVEVKVGGPETTALKALDKKINNFMGNAFARNTGNNMLDENHDTVESVSLVCKPPCKPPRKGDEKKPYNAGKKRSYPKSPDPSRVSPKRAVA